jgi:hypothetical protein
MRTCRLREAGEGWNELKKMAMKFATENLHTF